MGPQRQAVGSCPLSFWPSFPQRRPPGPWCVLYCSRRLCQPSRDPSPDPALKLHPCTHDNSGVYPIVVLVVKNPPANAGDIRDTGSVPGSGRSPGGGHGNPLQCSCLESPMDRAAWSLQSMGLQGVGLDWAATTFTFSLGAYWSVRAHPAESDWLKQYVMHAMQAGRAALSLCVPWSQSGLLRRTKPHGYAFEHPQPRFLSLRCALQVLVPRAPLLPGSALCPTAGLAWVICLTTSLCLRHHPHAPGYLTHSSGFKSDSTSPRGSLNPLPVCPGLCPSSGSQSPHWSMSGATENGIWYSLHSYMSGS